MVCHYVTQILQFLLPKNTLVDFNKKLVLPQNFKSFHNMFKIHGPIGAINQYLIKKD